MAFANDLSMYKYSGDKKYLDSAIEKADKYLEEVVYAESFIQQDSVTEMEAVYEPSL